MHLHDICIRGIIVSICPPQEPQGILVFLTHTYLMKHLFDVSSERYFSLAETWENTNQVVGYIGSSQQVLIRLSALAFSCCIEYNAHLAWFGRTRYRVIPMCFRLFV